jgi:hypothetical protein
MYAKGMDEEECAEWLEDVLTDADAEGGAKKKTAKAKPAAKAAV